MSHNPSGGLALFIFLACLIKQVLNQAKRIMIRQEVPQAVGEESAGIRRFRARQLLGPVRLSDEYVFPVYKIKRVLTFYVWPLA